MDQKPNQPIQERYGRLSEMDRSFDISCWQRQGLIRNRRASGRHIDLHDAGSLGEPDAQ